MGYREGVKMKGKNWLTYVIPPIMLIFGILGFLYGPGLLLQPNVIIKFDKVDMKFPEELHREIMYMKLVDMTTEMKDILIKSMESLGEEGVVDLEKKIKVTEEGKLTPSKKLTLDEQARLTRLFMKGMFKGMKQEIFATPNHIFNYTITNVGKRGAIKPFVKICIPGIYCESEVYSQNEIIREDRKDNILTIELDRLSPNSYIKGSVWYDESKGMAKEIENLIVVTFENGNEKGRIVEASDFPKITMKQKLISFVFGAVITACLFIILRFLAKGFLQRRRERL